MKSCTATSSSSRRIPGSTRRPSRDRCSRPARSSFAAICRRSRSMDHLPVRLAADPVLDFQLRCRTSDRLAGPAAEPVLAPVPALAGNQFAYAIPKPKLAPMMAARMRNSMSSSCVAPPRFIYPNNCGEELTAAGSIRRATNLDSLLTMTTQPSSPRMRGIQYAAASRSNHCRLWNTGSSAFADDAAASITPIYPRHCERSEAIHVAAQRKNGLLRFARNDDKPHLRSSIPAARSPGLCKSFRPKKRAPRECRVFAAPAVSRAKGTKESAHEHTGTVGEIPTFPAQWLYGLCRALPGDEFVLSPSSAN